VIGIKFRFLSIIMKRSMYIRMIFIYTLLNS